MNKKRNENEHKENTKRHPENTECLSAFNVFSLAISPRLRLRDMDFSSVTRLSYNKFFQLVGNVGKKSHLTSSLNCNGKLSLVKSAVAAYTSGEDLCSLGNELSELCNVLVIDLSNLVLAEDANLLSSVVRTEAAALCIVSFHR